MANYHARRSALAKRLPAESVAIISAAHEKIRNGDSHYRFRQDSDFYYLTGFNEPDAILVVMAGDKGESILFNRPKDPIQEAWTGPRLGQDDVAAVLGIPTAFSIEHFNATLPELLLDKKAIYYPMGRYMGLEATLKRTWRKVKKSARREQAIPDIFGDVAPLLGELRVIKDATEIGHMKEAARLSVHAHQCVMHAAKGAQYEHELLAEFLYALGKAGCQDMAYDAIVAGGANACILHYTANNAALNPDDLLLVDAGAEVNAYAADVTRTYPLSGKFSAEQRTIYDLVWKAQKAGIAAVKPGAPWHSMQDAVVEVFTEGLTALGLLNDKTTLQTFYMHSSGHWLGLDVHDTGAYKIEGASRPLEPGMVLTVEPGIYIAKDCEAVDARWRGIGVRIEDDILVTQDGYENLTAALEVAPEDLEALVGG